MDSKTKLDTQRVGRTFNLAPELAEKIAELLATGLSPTYLALHHQHELPGVADWQIFGVKRSLSEERTLDRRRQSLLAHLQAAGRLTPDIEAKIAAARTTHAVDVLQAVWKRRRAGSTADPQQASLADLADQALAGAKDDEALVAALAELEIAPTDAAPPSPEASTPESDSEAPDAGTPDAGTPDAGTPDADAVSTETADAASEEAESSAEGPAARTSPSATLRELIKERLRTHMGLYERVAALLRNRGKVTCRMATSPDDPVTETKPQSNSEGNAFAEGVLPQRATSSSQEAAPKDEAVQVVDALTPEKTVDAADIRRRRRKESRRRRRAHLESTFKDFTNAKFPVSKVLPWQYLMMDHADRLRILELVIEAPPAAELKTEAQQALAVSNPLSQCVSECMDEVLMHDILPELKRLLRKELSSRAQSHAAKHATSRIRELLQAPAHPVPVLAIDITGKSDAEIAVLDATGNVVVTQSTSLGDGADQRAAAVAELKRLVEEHGVRLIAIGEGSRGRALESVLANLVVELPDVGYAMVNRDGTEHYATSPLGSRELPQHAAKSRAAISLGRRLQDPLAELGKIEPRHLVATSWPIIPDEAMNERLGDTVAACAGRLGVDLNKANEILLAHVPGLDEGLAEQIVTYRRSHGPFKRKQDVRQVEGINDAQWDQAAGFLRVVGEDPLDHALLHPDQYPAATSILERAGLTAAALSGTAPEPTASAALEALEKLDAQAIASELALEQPAVSALIAALKASILARREATKDYAIQTAALAFEDLSPDDELLGTVSKVVSFGIFVDLGCGLTGLCHVSQMGSHQRDAREHFAVGDLKRVEVVSLDPEQRHIALRLAGTQAGSSSPKREGRSRRPAGGKGKRDRGHGKPRGPRKPIEVTARAKGKKAPPITKAMKEGDEPMRTFGDLKQFFEQDDSKPED